MDYSNNKSNDILLIQSSLAVLSSASALNFLSFAFEIIVISNLITVFNKLLGIEYYMLLTIYFIRLSTTIWIT